MSKSLIVAHVMLYLIGCTAILDARPETLKPMACMLLLISMCAVAKLDLVERAYFELRRKYEL